MVVRTAVSALFGVLAFLLVALSATGATAHGGAPHAHAASHAGDSAKSMDPAVVLPAEMRAKVPMPADHQTDRDCGDRGCCGAGHCSGCTTALAPASWTS